MQKEVSAVYLEAINRAIEFIESNSGKNIRLEEISDYAYLSKFHFHRIFKSVIGQTAKDYLTRLRLEKSAGLLKNTNTPINQIAYECGYGSPETFNRAFKAYFSTTPSKFRATTKQEIANKAVAYSGTTLENLHVSAPKVVEKPDLNLAYIRHFGSYENIDKSFQHLFLWAAKHLVLKIKPTTLGIVYDNPELTEADHLRFDACILVTKATKPKGDIGFKKIKGGRFAIFRYEGPFETFYPVYDYIYNVCLFENKWRLRDEPAIEWYINSPPFYKPKVLVTDFCLPIV